jgi:DNA-binding LacI/PurR family transcriptional regulator
MRTITIGKRQRIREFILEEIRNGRLAPGTRLPSRKDLMHRFGCARATADAAVEELRQAGLLTGRQGDGTFTVRPARQTRKPGIALLSPPLEANPFAREIVSGLLEAFGPDGQVRHFSYHDAKSAKGWELCKSREAIVFVMPDTEEAPLLAETRRNGHRHLVVYRDDPESPFVCIDNSGAVRSLVAELKRKGCGRIAYWGAQYSRYRFSEERYIGYLEGLNLQSLPFGKDLVLFGPENRESAGLPRLLEAVRSSGRETRTGFICEGRPVGSLLGLCGKAGLRPGEDFEFASFDPVAPGAYPFPVLCTASVTAEAGRIAAGMLVSAGTGPGLDQRYLLPDIKEINPGG